MANKDLIVIGASSGGIEALKVLVSALPADFPASIFIVLHISAESPGILPIILSSAGTLSATHAGDGEAIQPGRIYVAPPDHHLLVESPGYVRLTRGPKENRFRPAIDPLFRSAALAFGPRVIGVILSGGLDDGTAGLWAIKRRGGTAVVQDPEDALAPSMPISALRNVIIDHCLPAADLAPLLVRLAGEPAQEERVFAMPKDIEIEVRIASEDKATEARVLQLGDPSPFTCPECHGTLIQLADKSPLRFRCHTGHAFSVNSLLAGLSENIEDSLWNSIRAIEESVMLMKHLAVHLSEHENADNVALLLQKAQDAQQRAKIVRQTVMSYEKINEDTIEAIEGAK